MKRRQQYQSESVAAAHPLRPHRHCHERRCLNRAGHGGLGLSRRHCQHAHGQKGPLRANADVRRHAGDLLVQQSDCEVEQPAAHAHLHERSSEGRRKGCAASVFVFGEWSLDIGGKAEPSDPGDDHKG